MWTTEKSVRRSKLNEFLSHNLIESAMNLDLIENYFQTWGGLSRSGDGGSGPANFVVPLRRSMPSHLHFSHNQHGLRQQRVAILVISASSSLHATCTQPKPTTIHPTMTSDAQFDAALCVVPIPLLLQLTLPTEISSAAFPPSQSPAPSQPSRPSFPA